MLPHSFYNSAGPHIIRTNIHSLLFVLLVFWAGVKVISRTDPIFTCYDIFLLGFSIAIQVQDAVPVVLWQALHWCVCRGVNLLLLSSWITTHWQLASSRQHLDMFVVLIIQIYHAFLIVGSAHLSTTRGLLITKNVQRGIRVQMRVCVLWSEQWGVWPCPYQDVSWHSVSCSIFTDLLCMVPQGKSKLGLV